jgi:class 3 adenylate cyclase
LPEAAGDAVMAAFERPQDAVRAAIEMIEELSRFNETSSRPLGLKIGVHRGRAIAVRLNDRIDYFGQDVNIAARVQVSAEVKLLRRKCTGEPKKPRLWRSVTAIGIIRRTERPDEIA